MKKLFVNSNSNDCAIIIIIGRIFSKLFFIHEFDGFDAHIVDRTVALVGLN